MWTETETVLPKEGMCDVDGDGDGASGRCGGDGGDAKGGVTETETLPA